MNRTDEAIEWIKDHLTEAGGAAAAGDVIKAARAAGIAERTLQRARSKTGIRSEKGLRGWAWTHDPGTR